jgi:hypothetical protein
VSLRGVRAPALYSYQIGSSRGLVHLPTSGDVSVGTLSKDQVLVVRSEFTIRAYSRDGESLLVSMGERISTAESRVSVRGSDCVIRADTEHGRAFWVAPANASAVSFPHVQMAKPTLEGRTTLAPTTRIAVRVISLDGVEMEPLLGFKPTVGTYVQDAIVLPIAAEETVFQFRAHLKLGDLVWEQRVPDGALPARARYVPR